VNRSIAKWNQLREGATGTSQGKTHIFKTMVRGSEGDKRVKVSEIKGSEM